MRYVMLCVAACLVSITGCGNLGSQERMATGSASLQPWGKEMEGVRTRLVPVDTEFSLGKPMRFRLEMENVGDETVQYDSQQVAVNASMSIIDSRRKGVRYIAESCQTGGAPEPLKPGEQAVLFDNFDVAEQYLITAPGEYRVQFGGRTKHLGMSPFPPPTRSRFAWQRVL